MKYRNQTLEQAGKDMINDLEDSAGGWISIDYNGDYYFPYNTSGFWRGYVDESGIAKISFFEPGKDFVKEDWNLETE